MAYSKAHLFDPTTQKQSIWSKASAHPARIKILEYLFENGLTPFYEIKRMIPLAPTTVSHHVRHLYSNGYLNCTEKCPYTYYEVNKKACRDLAILLTEMQMQFIHSEFSSEEE